MSRNLEKHLQFGKAALVREASIVKAPGKVTAECSTASYVFAYFKARMMSVI